MTNHNVPLRVEFSIEVPGTPEQVWDALATQHGMNAWFLPSDVDERPGGEVRVYMGDDFSSPGRIEEWQPPHRLVISEPEWAALAGQDPSTVEPLVTEYLVDAQSGSTCVVKVVSNAFGVGADWEQEFFDDMAKNWLPYFEQLRLYLAHFAGQRATQRVVSVEVSGDIDTVWSSVCRSLGSADEGDPVELQSLRGNVEKAWSPPGPHRLLIRVSEPTPGFIGVLAYDKGDGAVAISMETYLFSGDAEQLVEREAPAWRSWIEECATNA